MDGTWGTTEPGNGTGEQEERCWAHGASILDASADVVLQLHARFGDVPMVRIGESQDVLELGTTLTVGLDDAPTGIRQ